MLKPMSHWRDGASHPLMLPLEFIQRPAFEAAVPWTAVDLDLATSEGRLCGVESREACARFGSSADIHHWASNGKNQAGAAGGDKGLTVDFRPATLTP